MVTLRRPLTLSTDNLLPLAKARIRQGLALTGALLATVAGVAQQTTPPPEPPTSSQVATAKNTTTVTIPVGARIALVLTQPIQTRNFHRGDDIYAQTTSPVTADNEVVIPPGTFVQGKFDKLARDGGRGELRLQSMSLTFPDGYTAPLGGAVTLESPDGYALKDPGNRRIGAGVAMIGGGVGVGALIGHFAGGSQSTLTSTLPPGCTGPPPGCLTSSVPELGENAKNTIIGASIGGAIGGVAAFATLFSSRNFFLDVGTPVEMTLQYPLTLEEDQVALAVQQSAQHPVPEQPVAQRPQLVPPYGYHGTCYTPGSPGTPGTDIPGTPATADSPGTPSIHIPGIPPSPPTPYPCP
jgi:hypothetical protein